MAISDVERGLFLDPDRLFPAEPTTRAIARDLYASVKSAPIISPHGHVSPELLLKNEPFEDAAALFIRDDHYVTRILHSAGVTMEQLGTASPREAWRLFCSHWNSYAGTASGYWLADEFASLFGIDEQPSATNADRLFEQIGEQLPGMLPRDLFERFQIDVLATTDDPLDDLAAHASEKKIRPTFRPDAYIDPAMPDFAERIERLGATSYDGYLDALAERRRYFIDHGAVSADHGVVEPYTVQLSESDAAALFSKAGTLSDQEQRAFRGHMLVQMARMSAEDGLVMTLHAGVRRNHHTASYRQFGADRGHDIPVVTEFTDNLRPLLELYGTAPGFHLILFSVDEAAYSREIAPLAGFYPSVFIGAPWWFLDAPDAAQRIRAATTETAGFYRGSGFIDDTRAFLSIPARHDMARRSDSAYLARLVVEGRIALSAAQTIAVDLVDSIPRTAFKL